MQIRKLRKWHMYGIIYTVHVPLCSIHFLISLIDKRSSFPMLYNPTFLYTFVFSISWLLKPAMYAYKYRLAFLSETNRWLSINYQTKKVCPTGQSLYLLTTQPLFLCRFVWFQPLIQPFEESPLPQYTVLWFQYPVVFIRINQ